MTVHNGLKMIFSLKATKQTVFGLILIAPISVLAQNAPIVTQGEVLRNIEQNVTPLPTPGPAPLVPEPIPNAQALYLKHLSGVTVDNDLIKKEIMNYWKPFLGQPVTNQDIAKFKDWAWSQFRDAGYFAFLYTEILPTADGQNLGVKVFLPEVQKIRIVGKDEAFVNRYAELIVKRMGKSVKQGSNVDTLSLEQLLESSVYDLPIDLELNIRPTGSNEVDLIVTINEKANDPGKYRGAVVQVNNYGLNQFGRGQLLGSASFDGFTPGSTASVMGQVSQGVGYGRLDYEAPSEVLGGRVRFWVASVYSRNIRGGIAATSGTTQDYGLGLTHILGSSRAMVFKSHVDASQRFTKSNLQIADIQIGNITDNQLRFRLTADNERYVLKHVQRYDAMLVAGSDNNNGQYSKIQLAASYRTPLTDSGLSIQVRGNAQIAPSRNLDSYNRMSLGGVNGVRAYTTIDGVGDAGVVGTIEIRQRLYQSHYVGIFYDGGVIKPNKTPIPGAFNSGYSLQATGLSFGGSFSKLSYSISIAKGIGGYAGYSASNIESSPNNLRFNAALTYQF
jgi:hemolysin activation/secretion protein